MHNNTKTKIKRIILRQFLEQNYTDYVFIGAFIDVRLSLIRRVIDTYPAETATGLSNELCQVSCLPLLTRAIGNFRQNIRALVRGLWTGNIGLADFIDGMELAIRTQITIAWNEGAAECGIRPDELTVDEINKRTEFIDNQIGYVTGFAEAIADGSKANKGKLTPLFQRAEMWINRYNEAKTYGAAMACGDEKREWHLGPTEQHCRSCAGFHGRVYRYSTWLGHNALPQNSNLACHGFNCRCRLDPTDKRVTPGKFPAGLLG